MISRVRMRRSATIGQIPTSLLDGELAINQPDRRLWFGDPTGTPVELIARRDMVDGGYYLKNDGSDATTALQQAVAINPNRTIGIPKGNYPISAPILLGASQTLIGEGEQNTVLSAVGSGYDVLALLSDNASVRYMGFTSAGPRSSGCYVQINNGTRSNQCERLKMVNAAIGIGVGNAVITDISGVEILNTAPTTGIGIWVYGGNDTYIQKVLMDATPSAQPRYGVFIQKTGAVWMDTVDMVHQGICLMMAPQAAPDEIDWCFFNAVAADTSHGGIYIQPAAGTVVKGVHFVDCWSATCDAFGVYLGGPGIVNGTRFIGHRSINNGNSGFAIQADAPVVCTDFNSCVAVGNSVATHGNWSGFDIGANINHFSITDCVSGHGLTFDDNIQGRGVLINAGTGSNYIVKDNRLTGNVTPMVNLATGNGEVEGNIGVQNIAQLGPTGTNFQYQAKQNGMIYITAGAIGAINLTRGGTVMPFATNVQSIPMKAGDILGMNYTTAPIIYFTGW